MRSKPTITTAVLLAACGQSDKQQLREAANQSDPQEPLQEAGKASAGRNSDSNAQ